MEFERYAVSLARLLVEMEGMDRAIPLGGLECLPGNPLREEIAEVWYASHRVLGVELLLNLIALHRIDPRVGDGLVVQVRLLLQLSEKIAYRAVLCN